jgi:hypothetical protein
MSHPPAHTAILLHPHAHVPWFKDHTSDFALWGPYASFQATSDLRHVVWPVSLALGREIPIRKFILDGVLVPGDFVPGSGPDGHVATLFEDGSCAIHPMSASPASRFLVDGMFSIRHANATDAPPSPAPDPFGRAGLEHQGGLSAYFKFQDIEGTRCAPNLWTALESPGNVDLVAHARHGSFAERMLNNAFRHMREAENRILNLEQGKDRNAALQAVEAAMGRLHSVIQDEDGPKDRIADMDGLWVYNEKTRWKHFFRAIDAMRLSPDGKRLAVVGERAGWRIAIDDQPGPGFDRIAGFRWFDPDRCGYLGFRDGRIWRVTVEV